LSDAQNAAIFTFLAGISFLDSKTAPIVFTVS